VGRRPARISSLSMDNADLTAPFWEAVYDSREGSAFGEPSNLVVSLAETLSAGATVLDLGCGDGRHALFFASHGFDVTAVDISESGIRKTRSLASDGGLTLRVEVADMRSYHFDRQFDLIISYGCLHLLERTEWKPLLERIKAHTLAGGKNFVTVFTDAISLPPDLKPFCIGLFREGELFQHYIDWQVEFQRSYVLADEHPGDIHHVHHLNEIVARRPD
jgi:tellurite methyltransferase